MISEEWDFVKNDLTPAQVTSRWSSSMAPFRSLMGGKDDGSLFKMFQLAGAAAAAIDLAD
ncbi:MAG: hypothetical protein FRX49_06128 [Trebouxia sp. A1-2]|nr:MAG: hypothetical protein FRX49_06128 [Trebouxia sp. A1-2]